MADTRTIVTTETSPLPALATVTAGAEDFGVRIEDDASPVVRLIGRTLRDAVRTQHAQDVLAATCGVVTVRSHDTPQVATVVFDGRHIGVRGGVHGTPQSSVVVDLHARFAPTQEPAGDAALAAAALLALRPPVPPWRPAAARFWELTRQVRGIPDVLHVEADGPDGRECGRFGQGSSAYLMAGPADTLAGVFSGLDDLLVALEGELRVRGTLSQLSVMTGASWKVRFDV